MLKRTKYFIGGLLIALTVGAIAQTSGLPSRPRFLSVGVGTSAPSTNGNMNVAGSVTASNFVGNVGGVAPTDFARLSQRNTFTHAQNAGAPTSAIYLDSIAPAIGFRDADGTANNRIYDIIANGGMLAIRAANDSSGVVTNAIEVTNVNGVVSSLALAGTSITANGFEICRQNGIGCPPASGPKHAYGKFTANASGCSINSAWQNIGFASCTRSSAGIYTASFTPSYFSGPGNPICVANQDAPTVGFAAVNTSNLSGVTVSTVNTSFTVADNGTFTVICHGN